MSESDPLVAELRAEIESLRARMQVLERAEQEHEKIAEALRDSEERLRRTTESLPIVLFSAEAVTNRILLMIGAVKELFGYDPEQFYADPEFGPSVIHPDDAQMVHESYVKGLASGRPFEVVYRCIHGVTGEPRWIQQKIVPVLGADGTLIRQDVVIWDITASKRAEDALRESERRLRAVVEATPIVLFAIDVDGVITLCEGKPIDTLNIRPQDLVGKSIYDLPPDLPDISENFHRALSGEAFTATVEFGGRFFEICHSALRDAQGKITGIIGVANDVTDRNRLQSQLLQSQKLQSIGTLAGGVAHDFGNLLAVIIGNLSIVLRQDSMPARAMELLRDIMDAAERASALTQQLLAFARGGLQKPAPTNLNRHVESVLQIARRTAPREIDFAVSLDPDLPQVIADPAQMEQVIMNLCLNAVEASRPPARIEVSTAGESLTGPKAAALELAAGDYVRLRVQDCGCGMDRATVERVFEPFFTTKPTGRGMGLAATQGIIHSHKGQIRIESAVGRGTTATVWLPAAPWEKSRKLAAGKPERSNLPRGNETILVVQATEPEARAAEANLSSLGYCTVAHIGLKPALAFLETNSDDVDLVLLGADIPPLARLSPLSEIRRKCQNVPILVTGPSQTDASVKRLRKQGAAAFIRMPFDLPKLANVVRACLDESPRQERDDKP